MSDEEDYPDNCYGIDDEYLTSFKNNNGETNSDDEQKLEIPSKPKKPLDIDDFSLQKYEKNPKIKTKNENKEDCDLDEMLDIINNDDDQEVEEEVTEKKQNNEKDGNDNALDDLLELMNDDDDDDNEEQRQRKKVLIPKKKKEDSKPSPPTVKNSSSTTESNSTKSSIKITKIPPKTVTDDKNVFIEKNTQLSVIKSEFKNEIEMNMRLMSDLGKFLKLSDVNRRTCELKEAKDFKWYSIFVLGSKTDTKSSAQGNNYVIWRVFDPRNLDKQQEISLFLFGAAYKTHWKSSEFEAFALVQPDILDNKKPSNSSSNSGGGNSYFDKNTHSAGKKIGNYSSKSSWNSFATKNVDLANKLTLSVKADFQLIPLGIAKDITNCQSNTNGNPETMDPSTRCKNIVNLQDVPFCMYHCKNLEKDKKKPSGVENKYSMNSNKPFNRLTGTEPLFKSNATSDTKFAQNTYIAGRMTPNAPINFEENNDGARFVPSGRVSLAAQKVSQIEQRKKVVTEMKHEIVSSLTQSISQTIDPVIGIMGKKNKKSDKELLALFDGKELDKDEIRKIRIEENQSTIQHVSGGGVNKEMSKLFNSKVLLPSESNSNNTITSQKMLQYKKEQTSAIILNDYDYAAGVKNNINDKKGNMGLSTMMSHKDICKKIKKKEETDKKDEKKLKSDDEEEEEIVEVKKPVKKNPGIMAASFLKSYVSDLKNTKKENMNSPKLGAPKLGGKNVSSGFDLDLYVGDKLVTKKLLDVKSKYLNHSHTPTSASKRKFDDIKKSPVNITNTPNKLNESIEEKKSKKLKMLDDILSIKSNHKKEVDDPEKNPHMKAYFEKLEIAEKVDNKLSSTKNREVKTVTCSTCNYTSFFQSDYCKKLRHIITRQMSIQRYFKCKICNNKMHTLDKKYPASSCGQCGNSMFESCGMKEQDCSINGMKEGSLLDQHSEMYLTNGD